MRCFFVVARENSGITDSTIATNFDKNYVIVPGSAWAVAHSDPFATTMDVCNMLEIGQEGGRTGIVLSVSQYNGYFDSALWESLAQWGNAP